MRNCAKCDDPIPLWNKIDGKRVNAQHRRFCFTCSPYKSHNTKDLCASPKKKITSVEAVTKWRRNLKTRMVKAMGGKCQCCGYDRCHNALELHHRDPSQKEHSFGGLRGHPRSWSVIVEELRKCVLLCAICHREVHANIRTVPLTAIGFDERWVDYRDVEKMVHAEGLEPPLIASV